MSASTCLGRKLTCGAGWLAGHPVRSIRYPRSALESLVEIEEQPLRAYAATLILAVATADRLVVAQLGDGAVVAGESPDKPFPVNQTKRVEYANETYFLTQEAALEEVPNRCMRKR